MYLELNFFDFVMNKLHHILRVHSDCFSLYGMSTLKVMKVVLSAIHGLQTQTTMVKWRNAGGQTKQATVMRDK